MLRSAELRFDLDIERGSGQDGQRRVGMAALVRGGLCRNICAINWIGPYIGSAERERTEVGEMVRREELVLGFNIINDSQ